MVSGDKPVGRRNRDRSTDSQIDKWFVTGRRSEEFRGICRRRGRRQLCLLALFPDTPSATVRAG